MGRHHFPFPLLLLSTFIFDDVLADDCISELKHIYMAEEALLTTETKRNYVLCSDTIFTPGPVDESGTVLIGSDAPLVCRSNCTIECENNCILDGSEGSTYGIFLMPSLAFGSTAMDPVVESIVISGVTVRGWTDAANQIPVVVGGTSGSVTFKKCTFEDNQADPLFLLDQYMMSEAMDGRSLSDTLNEETELSSRMMFPTRRQLVNPNSPEEENENHRQLPELGDSDNLVITFDNCIFRNNIPPNDAQTLGGYSLVRFRGTDPTLPEDQVATSLHAIFDSCDFVNNTFVLKENEEASLSLIDFYSTGNLTLEKNCFEDSPTQSNGLITMQSGAQVMRRFNYVKPGEANSKVCDFIAALNPNYELLDPDEACYANTALQTTCRPNFFCFPGDSLVETENQGTIPMKELQLGDRIQTASGKFEPVYSFGHYGPDQMGEFVRFILSTGDTLELSASHMVFIAGQSYPIPASMVKPEDVLQTTATATAAFVQDIVRITKSQGVYAPFTTSGTLVVNGVICSSFIYPLETYYSNWFGWSMHALAHRWERWHRWYYYLFQSMEESYTKEGLSTWVAPYYEALLQNNTVMMIYMGVQVILPDLVVILAAAAFVRWQRRRHRKTLG